MLKRRVIVAVLLLAGIGLWWTIGGHYARKYDLLAPLLVIGAYSIPTSRQWLGAAITWLEHRRYTSLTIFALAATYLYVSAVQQNRFIGPQWHDDYMHLLQIQMLARGRLWYPQHQLADFFESFHIFTTPVYASIYFPGAALLYVPAVWLGVPMWLLPIGVAAACASLLYSVVANLVRPLAGITAAIMLVAIERFQFQSLTVQSHLVMLFLGLMLIWSWLRWRERGTMGWSLLLGAFGGWAAITRPVDAICYATAIAVVSLPEVRKRWRQIPIILLAAMPFLALQLIQNVGLTGHLFTTPYRLYANLFTPNIHLGFHDFDAQSRPKSALAQRQLYYDTFTATAVRQHRPENVWRDWVDRRFRLLVDATLPHRLLLLFFPLGLLGLNDRRRLAMLLNLPLFIGSYAFFAYFGNHYSLVVAPAMILAVLLGAHVLGEQFLIMALALSVISLPQFDSARRSPPEFNSISTAANLHLRENIQTPAIVLFRFTTGDNPFDEPVYNVDVAWPDDAVVIRAHDLGSRNIQLYRYYAERQPRRFVYLFDRGKGTVTLLGTAADLAQK